MQRSSASSLRVLWESPASSFLPSFLNCLHQPQVGGYGTSILCLYVVPAQEPGDLLLHHKVFQDGIDEGRA